MTKPTSRTNGGLTVKDAIIDVLNEFRRPMNYGEITRHVRERAPRLRGKTPDQTVNATLTTNTDVFVKVARGVYALSDWSVEQQAAISTPTRLTELSCWGFRSYPDRDMVRALTMTPLSVLIGPNSSGKSNLLDMLLLISEAADQKLSDGVRRRNGMRSILWQNGAKEFGWELVLAAEGAFAAEEGPLHYRVVVRPRGESPSIALEEVAVEAKSGTRVLLSAMNGAVRLRAEGKPQLGPETPLTSDSELAISQIRDPQNYPTLSRLRDYLASWAIYREFLTDEQSKMRQPQVASADTQLQPHGENLIAVLHQINNRTQYRPYNTGIRELLRLAFEDFEELYFPAEPGASGKIGLAWKDRSLSGDLDVSQLSDGMLRFLALSTLLAAPDLPPLVCVDEPEIGLHPALLHLVAGMAEKASARTQVILTTHSTQLINSLSRPEYVTVVERDKGATTLRRLDAGKLGAWLRDFTLGELWLQGEIGGRP